MKITVQNALVCNMIVFNCHVMKIYHWCTYRAVVIFLRMLQLHYFKNRKPCSPLNKMLAEATIDVNKMVKRTTPAHT
jgi:hypothetical protein